MTPTLIATEVTTNGDRRIASPDYPVPVSIFPGATVGDPGYSTFRTAALTNAAQAVKAAAGNLFGVNLVNINTVPVYVKFYDLAAGSVVVGTTVPVRVIAVPAGDGVTPGIVLLMESFSLRYFAAAIAAACVTGLADASAAAPTTPIYAEAIYK